MRPVDAPVPSPHRSSHSDPMAHPSGPLTFLCSSTSWGGLEHGVVRLLRWLGDRAWPVTLLAVEHSPLAAAARDAELPMLPIRRHWRHGDLPNALRLARLLRRIDAPALLTFDARDLGIASDVSMLTRRHIRIIHYQNMQVGVSKRGLLHWLQQRRIDAWIAPLDWLAEQALQRTRLRPDQIVVIPHGIEVAAFRSNGWARDGARQRLELPQDAFIAGLTGRIDAGKGHHLLIEAIHRLHERGIHAHALFVGDPTMGEGEPYLIRLHAMCDSLHLQDQVHFRPFMKDIAIAYRAMDAFVLGTLSETFGMVTVEAMLSGIPVIGSDAGGTPDILGHGRLGLLYPPGDVHALTQALSSLIIDPDTASARAAMAQEHAVATWSHTAECNRVEALLGRLGVIKKHQT